MRSAEISSFSDADTQQTKNHNLLEFEKIYVMAFCFGRARSMCGFCVFVISFFHFGICVPLLHLRMQSFACSIESLTIYMLAICSGRRASAFSVTHLEGIGG